MPARISVLQRIILDIAVAIERLGVPGSPRRRRLLLLLSAQLEPETLAVLVAHTRHKAWLVEIHREWFERHAVHAPRSRTRHDTIPTEEATERRVVVAGMVVQQAGAVLALAGVVQRGMRADGGVGGAWRTPWVVLLRALGDAGRVSRR